MHFVEFSEASKEGRSSSSSAVYGMDRRCLGRRFFCNHPPTYPTNTTNRLTSNNKLKNINLIDCTDGITNIDYVFFLLFLSVRSMTRLAQKCTVVFWGHTAFYRHLDPNCISMKRNTQRPSALPCFAVQCRKRWNCEWGEVASACQ